MLVQRARAPNCSYEIDVMRLVSLAAPSAVMDVLKRESQ
jgi:hypothetical protein